MTIDRKYQKKPGMELVKIIAIILIIISHSIPCVQTSYENVIKLPEYIIDVRNTTNSVQGLLIILLISRHYV